MKKMLAGCVAAVGILSAAPLMAHHSFAAEFDATKGIKLTGAVTKIEWMNPHAYFYIDASEICEGAGDAAQTNGWKCKATDAAKVPHWGLEMGSPNGLMRQGWNRKSMQVGDIVTVEGSRAKDGSNVGNARSVMMSSGQRLFAASSQGTNP